MRFDPHKAKASRRWNARSAHNAANVTATASPTTPATNTAATNEHQHDSTIISHHHKIYDGPDDILQEVESNQIDKEAAELLEMIRDTKRNQQEGVFGAYDPSTYFRFQDEVDFTVEGNHSHPLDEDFEEDGLKMWSLDMSSLSSILASIPLHNRCGIQQDELRWSSRTSDTTEPCLLRAEPRSALVWEDDLPTASSTTTTSPQPQPPRKLFDLAVISSAAVLEVPNSLKRGPEIAKKAVQKNETLKLQQQQQEKQQKHTSTKPRISAFEDELDDLLDSPQSEKPATPSTTSYTAHSPKLPKPSFHSVHNSSSATESSRVSTTEQEDLEFLDELLGSE